MSSPKNRKPARPLVVRLTLWYAVVLLATVTAFSLFLYYRLRHNLIKQHDKFVELNSKDFAGEVAENLGHPNRLKDELEAEVPHGRRNNIVYRLWTPDGRAVLESARFPDYPLDRELLSRAVEDPDGPLDPWTAEGKSGYPYRMTAQAVRAEGDVVYVIESGYSLRPIFKTLGNYRRNFVRFLVPLLIIAIAGGWWLARKSLAPIADMANAARAISYESLEKRIPVKGTGDELDQLAQVLNRMLERLEDAFQRIERFSSDLAHELRTPLTALKGESERALMGARSPDELRSVIAAQAETYDRLNGMIADLLLLARGGAGEARARFQPVDLAAAIREAVETFQPVADDLGVTLASAGLDDPCPAEGEPSALRRVFSNLLDNALKHTPAGSSVSVEVRVDRDGTVRVRDTGCGIAPDDLPHVFDRFYRADRSRSRETGGFGLGLSICKRIVEEHGGTISVRSEVGAGTEVTVRLPLRHAGAAPSVPAEDLAAPPSA